MSTLIYLIGITDPLRSAFYGVIIGAVVLGLIALFMLIPLYAEEEYKIITKVKRTIKLCTLTLVIASTGYTFIPSSKVLTAMILLPKLAENTTLLDISHNSLELIDLKLKEYVKQLQEEL